MAKEYNIRWRRSDYGKLSYAIREFNKKVQRLQAEEQRLYLPLQQKYKNVKRNITTRKELNNILRRLKAFNVEGAENLYETQEGEKMTVWEHKELEKSRKRLTKTLKTRLEELNVPKANQKYSRVQMRKYRSKKNRKSNKKFRKY